MPEDVQQQYSVEEQTRIVGYLMALKKSEITAFLEEMELTPRYGIKAQLRDRIERWLGEGELRYEDIVDFLDEIMPWGKQHVFLYDGPEEIIENWRSEDWVQELVEEHDLGTMIRARLPLILPPTLQLSSIEYSPSALRVFCVERRDAMSRRSDLDREGETEAGDRVEYRAYVEVVDRGIVIFTWDLVANEAALQISQLPSGTRYEDVEARFTRLVRSWLRLSRFRKIDISHSIKKLHELEQAGTPEARSHGYTYRTLEGRTFSGRSATQRESVLGEPAIDNALGAVRNSGIGHLGNFYWRPATGHQNPLRTDLHVILVARKKRVNFPVANSREHVEYVLSRIRALSR